ncbi:MAG: adenylyltransferase/cytidyltransferase family protein [Verrucomicrobia bacterium]|jgi:cytidyltransferase-like protein|nr:adenylyltransferase/cytidyltransferase family protein [Verrucomicrobiota bacterium]MBT7067452.1 adenylyltransferase/cytidyltransferase family protein [Verrucomicrobiota bacterium]MBT7700155.1 adenylyltransferase/cytidyltransferase family protein [Verrucomicrobiota bacterium]
MTTVVISASFDNARSPDYRFAEEAAKLGALTVLLWSDAAVRTATGADPKFPQEEREYLVQAMRYVTQVVIVDDVRPDALPQVDGLTPSIWAVKQPDMTDAKRRFGDASGITIETIPTELLNSFPEIVEAAETATDNKKVVVTGCYDWFHSGHVAFFEEVSSLGDLYVVVGHDANILLLKGEGHPMFSEQERRYIAGSIRYVHQALISSGSGWMDAEPEIEHIHPDRYAVNEDGDKPEKQAFCKAHDLEYVVLKRIPKEGLPRRESTHLRGF